MNQDIFCLNIPNPILNDSFQVQIFNENNYEFLNYPKNNSYYINNCPVDNYEMQNSLNNTKNDFKTFFNKENEKDLKLNNDSNEKDNLNNNCLSNNTDISDNNIYNCNGLKLNENILYNDNKLFEDYLFNFPLNDENNLIKNNESSNLINKNFGFNCLNSNKNYIIDINDINKFFINNSECDNELFQLDNEKIYKKYLDYYFSTDKPKIKTNNNICNINLGVKRKLVKRIKEKEIIQYGHPNKINYKTMRQKLNIHKKLDLECRNDTILLIYSISKLKQIIKKFVSKKNIKDKIYFHRIENIYKNSIISLQHRENANDIIGPQLV